MLNVLWAVLYVGVLIAACVYFSKHGKQTFNSHDELIESFKTQPKNSEELNDKENQ